jgi:hypothetical protein
MYEENFIFFFISAQVGTVTSFPTVGDFFLLFRQLFLPYFLERAGGDGGGAGIAGSAAAGGPERHGGDGARPAVRSRHTGRDTQAAGAGAGAQEHQLDCAQSLHRVRNL